MKLKNVKLDGKAVSQLTKLAGGLGLAVQCVYRRSPKDARVRT